jgi:hypothetical protein
MDNPLPPLHPPGSAAPALKHSWLGIASFVISILGGLAMLLLVGVAGYLQMSTPGGMDEKSTTAIVVGLLLFAVMGAHLVGAGLAIAGLTQKDRRKVFAVLGLVFNVLVILCTLGLMVIGNSVE